MILDGLSALREEFTARGWNRRATGAVLRELARGIGVAAPDERDFIKRVVGVGGDRVRCCDDQGRIVLNGVPLDEPYLKPGDATDQVRFDVTVPADGLFVMGDNRADSRDSRYHLDDNDGAVPVSSVVGRVLLVVWPFDRFATVPIPSTFDAIPAPSG